MQEKSMLRKTFSLLSAAVLSACVSHEGRPTGPAGKPPVAAEINVQKAVTYTPANWPTQLQADIYSPQGAGPFPAVVTIHGGGWTGRTRDDMNSIAEALAKRGYVVMNVSYRLAPAWHFPAQLNDVQ